MSTLDDLIGIYGRQPADRVPEDPEYQALCKVNDSKTLFHYERRRVETIRRRLEGVLDQQETRQKQVKNALKIFDWLLAPDNNQEDEICRRLVRADWYQEWTQQQQAHFDATVETLRNGLDYFLSFTQRNSVGAGNPVNAFHRYLIQSYGLEDPNSSPKNELAKAVDRALRISRYKFRGFFFPMHEDDSTEVTAKLRLAMDRALVFIQIVQNEMFDKGSYKDTENYCFDEYTMAVDRRKNHIYLFADGQHPADLIPKGRTFHRFETWFEFVKKTDCVALARTLDVTRESQNVAVNQDLLNKRLIDKVQSFREALWNNSPPDLMTAQPGSP